MAVEARPAENNLRFGGSEMWSTTPFKCGALSKTLVKVQVRGGRRQPIQLEQPPFFPLGLILGEYQSFGVGGDPNRGTTRLGDTPEVNGSLPHPHPGLGRHSRRFNLGNLP